MGGCNRPPHCTALGGEEEREKRRRIIKGIGPDLRREHGNDLVAAAADCAESTGVTNAEECVLL